jgi:hypothetical protein
MADYGVISDVSTSLETLLNQDLGKPLNTRALLDDLSEAARAWLTLTITLNEILEDAPSRNRARPERPARTAIVSTKPPMALWVHYLHTPWGEDALTTAKRTPGQRQHHEPAKPRGLAPSLVRDPEAVPAVGELGGPRSEH